MTDLTRRQLLLATAGLAVTASVGGGALLISGGWLRSGRFPRVPRVGLAVNDLKVNAVVVDALRGGLRDLGLVDGQNIAFELREAGQEVAIGSAVAELIALPVDVLVVGSSSAALPAHRATSSTPIVMAGVADPLELGLIAGLAHPGGNVTGVARFSAELSAKQLEVLKTVLPTASRFAILVDATMPSMPPIRSGIEAAAATLGVELRLLQVTAADQLQKAVDDAAAAGVNALVVVLSGMFLAQRAQIARLVGQARLPAIYSDRLYVKDGGLLAYGENIVDMFRRSAVYVDRILKGAKPADLPVEHATTFELTVNATALQSLGLSIPQSVLPQVTEWIQ